MKSITKLSLLAYAGGLLLSGPAAAQISVINVEIDYMVAGDHNHMPQPDEIAAVVSMFAQRGITLNVIVDDAIAEIPVMGCSDGSCTGGTCTPGFFECNEATGFATIKANNFDSGDGWHYCVFGHQYDCGCGPTSSSGLSEVGGDDFVVTLGGGFAGQVGTPFDRASTFAHELGHNLGLQHFGPVYDGSQPPGPFQRNYASIMSYEYQLTGVRTQMLCTGLIDETAKFKEMDFSSGVLPNLVEVGMSEAVGVGIHPMDYNCNGVVDAGPVASEMDANGTWCNPVGQAHVLRDFNDWNYILTSASPVPNPSPFVPVISCITADEIAERKGLENPSSCDPDQPPLVTEFYPPGIMIWVDGNAPAGGNGAGAAPLNSISFAAAAAPDHSVLYLQPSTLTNGGTPVVITKPLTLAGPGGAVISP